MEVVVAPPLPSARGRRAPVAPRYRFLWVLGAFVLVSLWNILQHYPKPAKQGHLGQHALEREQVAITRGSVGEKEEKVLSAITGTRFEGNPFRKWKGPRKVDFSSDGESRLAVSTKQSKCRNWVVVTTIFGPTEAVRRVAQLPSDEWCIVVVADTKTPSDYLDQLNMNGTSHVYFLSIERQREWEKASNSAIGDLVRATPYQHFARKHLGYFFAIAHKAKFIFDLDDDNLLRRVTSPVANETHLQDVNVVMLGKNMFNPHLLMNATLPDSWPRGFPIESVLDKATQGRVAYSKGAVKMDKIGVMQICANGNPDVDAVHRLVKPLPMDFEAECSVLVPSHAFVPYNAQATIHTPAAHWALLLPATVGSRVTDIWRAYFAEALFRDLDLKVAFLPPTLTQDRNEHSYLADMQGELDLYFKAGPLIEFLTTWTSEHHDNIPARMEALWIELYERGYIEEADVTLVQSWLSALTEIGYRFPRVEHRRYHNIALMGQFNAAVTVDSVLFWSQKWRQVFDKIQVYGPFTASQVEELKHNGIDAHVGENDNGHYSAIRNLAEALQHYKKMEGLKGVLYLHDDALLNMTAVTEGQYPFPTKDILVSRVPAYVNGVSFRVYQDGTYSKHAGDKKFTKIKAFVASKNSSWWWLEECVLSQSMVARDPRSKPYREIDRGIPVPEPAQSDFLFVPVRLADEFHVPASLMSEHKVFLECAFPTAVDMLIRVYKANIRSLQLCTIWDYAVRGTDELIEYCQKDSGKNYGMIHPFKLGVVGLSKWSDRFNELVF